VDGGDAEDGHDRVPDELLYGATVALDRAARVGEDALHDAAERLRIERLAEARGACHIRKHDGDGLPRLRHEPSVRRLPLAAHMLEDAAPADGR
jgi:hypothetical protein